MATQVQMIQAMMDKIAAQGGQIARLEDWKERHKGCVAKLEEQLAQEQEHREQTALRNRTLQCWKDQLEQQCLAARAILSRATSSSDLVPVMFELADLARDFFGHYPDLYRHDDREEEASDD